MITASEIAKRLSERAEEVSTFLLPNGKHQGQYWCVGSINGELGKSLRVCLAGEKKGRWSDYAESQHYGDMLDLWRLARQITLTEAVKQTKHYLGVGEPEFMPQRRLPFVKPEPKAGQEVHELVENSAVTEYLLQERKLNFATLQIFKIQQTSTHVVFPFWHSNEIFLLKYLSIERHNGEKKIFCSPRQSCLFGWQAIEGNHREITLTEGELDAMSFYQYDIPALSLPFGGGTGKKHAWLEVEFDPLSHYDKIYLCFDNDEVGKQTTLELVERLGRHRCFVVTLPHKDANACLQQEVTQAVMKDCFERATTCDPTELKSASQYVESVIKLFHEEDHALKGYLPPWKKCGSTIVFRPYELSLWTGINGHGKSQFLGFILLNAMQQGARVCIASLEIKPERLLLRLTRQATALALPSREHITAVHQWYADKLWLFDLVGIAKKERLLEVFLYARQRYGIELFLIDSLMKRNIAEDDLSAQKAFMDTLCDFKNAHPCHIHLIAHPRKGQTEMDIPGKLDIRGSSSIGDMADNCFTVWRNKSKNANEPDCIWQCDKQRNGEWEGKYSLWFDSQSFQFLEKRGATWEAIVKPPSLSFVNEVSDGADAVRQNDKSNLFELIS